MRVVFDTNVLISALITTGKPRDLFKHAIEGRIQLVTSKSILREFSQVSKDPRIRKYASEDDVIAFLKIIDKVAKITKVKSQFSVVKEDPDDDMVVRAAFDGKADYIVSGDKHLLLLAAYRGIRIINVDEMLTLLKEERAVN
jgi:putative PIN family toxin of toxin-antitoxin system